MKLDRNLAIILALCAVLLILFYAAFQGQQNPTKNGNANRPNQTENWNAVPVQQNQTENGNVNRPNQTQNGGAMPVQQNQAPDGNITGLGGIGTPGGNESNRTDGPGTTTVLPPLNVTTNISGLHEFDFMVVDDSLPGLLTGQKLLELPPPPG